VDTLQGIRIGWLADGHSDTRLFGVKKEN